MRRRSFVWIGIGLLCAGIAGCAGRVPAPQAEHATAWGFVHLLPREGFEPSSGGAYGDRRVGQAELVDYSRPGFLVVYLDDAREAPPQSHVVRIVDGRVRTHLEPAFLAVHAGDSVTIENRSKSPRLLSSPIAGLVRRMAPGQQIEVEVRDPGQYELFVLDGIGASSVIFVSPGSMAVASDAGRYALENVAPGRHRLQTWHPRFPPTAQWVDLPEGVASRVDIRVGVGRSGGEEEHADE